MLKPLASSFLQNGVVKSRKVFGLQAVVRTLLCMIAVMAGVLHSHQILSVKTFEQ